MRLPVKFQFTEVSGMLTCFSVGFAVRMVPELLAFPYPIGFDTVYYAAFMKSGVVWPHWTAFFTTSWLFPAVSVSLYKVVGGDPFMLLKVLAPLLFGLNVAGIFWLARKMLDWDARTSLLAGLFFAVQLASLRISWDLLRNTLGIGILLFTLPFIKNLNSGKRIVYFVLLSLLSVYAHEYAAVTLLAIVFSTILWSKLKGERPANSKGLLLASLPALAFFLMSVYLRLFPISYTVKTNVLEAGDVVNANVWGLFFLVDYLKVKTSVDWYSSYPDLLISVATLFSLLYLSYIFLVWKGFFKNRILCVWTALLSTGSFGCLIVPFCALQYWYRWMFMLVYPFTFYAINGVRRCLKDHDFHIDLRNKKVSCMVLATILFGCIYLATPILMNTLNMGIFSFNPVNKYISFAPTVPYQDVTNVVQAMKWLDINMKENDCVLLHHAFVSWGELYLNDKNVITFVGDVDLAVDTANQNGFNRILFVWWNEPVKWYELAPFNGFNKLQDFGRISVYEYVKV